MISGHLLLSLLIIAIGIIGIMASKRKNIQHSITRTGVDIDIDELAEKLAKAIGIEFREALKDLKLSAPDKNRKSYSTSSDELDVIEMDEGIIPMKIDTSKIESKLENMAKEETQVDKNLGASKDKLKNLFSKKGKK